MNTFDVAILLQDPVMMGLFATFAAGLTQMLKTHLKLSNHLYIQAISVAAFAFGVLLHSLLPDAWQLVFDLVAGGTGVTGTIGLAKELRSDARPTPRES